MSTANERQIGGDHYRKHGKLQHWDVVAHFGLDYFQAQILRYVMRWKDKDGIQDLEKAKHYLDKYIELETDAEADVYVKRAFARLAGDDPHDA